jgi:hypothetical protein
MKPKNKVLGVHNGALRTAPIRGQAPIASASRNMKMGNVTASIPGGGTIPGMSGGGNWSSVNQFFSTEHIYTLSSIAGTGHPLYDDRDIMTVFYQDMYLYDTCVGSAVDMMSTFPFSTFQLRGLPEDEIAPFQEACDRLNIETLLPRISLDYLVHGFFTGSLIFDPRVNAFVDVVRHDPVQTQVFASDFHNVDPEIHVNISGTMRRMLSTDSEYHRKYLSLLPPSFVQLLEMGSFTLDPVATLFVARKTLADRPAVSFLHRLLPIYFIEKTLFRGTLVEAHRRQRAMTHISAGDENWVPSPEELHQIVQMFQQAETDPMGGWITTRNPVNATDIRQGGDFWKWTDVAGDLVPYKLRGMGVSESFMSGDANYSAAEAAYSVFLETQDAYRQHLTAEVFYKKIFPLVAVTNELYKDPDGLRVQNSVMDFLFNSNSRANLKSPELHWDKQLEANREENMFEMLELLSQHQVPIPLKMWTAAAGIDIETLLRELQEDKDLRGRLKDITGVDTSAQTEAPPSAYLDPEDGGMGGDVGEGYEGSEIAPPPGVAAAAAGAMNSFTSMSTKHTAGKIPLLARDWDGLISSWSKSGNKKVHIYDQAGARGRSNDMIMKAIRNLEDPHNRIEAAKRNMEKTGRATLEGIKPGRGIFGARYKK